MPQLESAEVVAHAGEGGARVRRGFAVYAWFVLAYHVAIVLWGAVVRATGSGAGCGDHWPLCNGEVIPQAAQVKTLIELSHRVTSGLALPLVLGLLVVAFRRFPKGHGIRMASVVSLVLLMIEGLIGRQLVKLRLVAQDDSVLRAVVLPLHLVNTLLLLGALTLVAWWASGAPALRWRLAGVRRWVVTAGTVGLLLLGISGGIAALGDTLFPARSLAEGLQQDAAATAHFLLRLRIFHPLIAMAVGGFLVVAALAYVIGRPFESLQKWAAAVAGLTLLQWLAGLVNLWLLAPVWLQLVHLLLADALWIAFVLFGAELLSEGRVVRHG